MIQSAYIKQQKRFLSSLHSTIGYFRKKILLFKSSFRTVANYKNGELKKRQNLKISPRRIVIKLITQILCIFQVVASFIRNTFP